jgi:hypothetical protein
MARVTPLEVKQILDGCVVEDSNVAVIINSANKFITKTFANDSTMSADDLKEIERWLSAHFISITLHRQTAEEKVGDASAVFTGKWQEGLRMTSYGQTVLMLDSSGLIEKSTKQQASIYAVPKW